MEYETLKEFLMWCTILNGGLLILWSGVFILAPNMIYRIHSQWFKLSRETFDVALYSFIGVFKIGFLFFNLTPYVVLVIMS